MDLFNVVGPRVVGCLGCETEYGLQKAVIAVSTIGAGSVIIHASRRLSVNMKSYCTSLAMTSRTPTAKTASTGCATCSTDVGRQRR